MSGTRPSIHTYLPSHNTLNKEASGFGRLGAGQQGCADFLNAVKYLVIATRFALLALLLAAAAGAATLRGLPAHLRPDPFGGIVPADRIPAARVQNRMTLETPRAGHASLHLLIESVTPSAYRLEFAPDARVAIAARFYREWFHFLPSSQAYIPDALIPVELPLNANVPDGDNRVPGQTTAAYWLDLWIPPTVDPGRYTVRVILRTANGRAELPISVHVLNARVPAEDALTIDHNAYGTSWFATQYPHIEPEAYFDLIHAYHRIFYEHRGSFHQLGYGHAGKVGPEFAPQLMGSGRNRRIVDWSLYDRHYGPLLDGSAFAQTQRGPRPIPSVYLPINPEWPASFENWGEPGYEQEFVSVVSQMARHFREKNWTGTNFEVFFNQKKRYKGFAWDGDEPRFPKDYAYFREYGRLLKRALPADSPVHFVFRADASWTMERQWQELAGVVNFWVAGGGSFSWFPAAPDMLRKRGDLVWIYGGTPPVSEPSSHIVTDVLRAWFQNVGGFVRWETTQPGADPWFQFQGGSEALVYPGYRFGLPQPLPSIRLKLERNALEDLSLAGSLHSTELRNELANAFNHTRPQDWWGVRPALADTDPLGWSNADLEDATHIPADRSPVDSAAWQRAHELICRFAEQAK